MTKIKFDTDKEITGTLISYGVQYFRRKAGFIAPNAPLDECGQIDCHWVVSQKWVVNTFGHIHTAYYTPQMDDTVLGEVIYLYGRASVCYECAHEINKSLCDDTIQITCWIAGEYCQLCGKYEDGIPF